MGQTLHLSFLVPRSLRDADSLSDSEGGGLVRSPRPAFPVPLIPGRQPLGCKGLEDARGNIPSSSQERGGSVDAVARSLFPPVSPTQAPLRPTKVTKAFS